MTDYYAIFASLEPRLWELIIDVLLFSVWTDTNMFHTYFYPVFKIFPWMCESTIRRSWAGHYLRVHGPPNIQYRHCLFDCHRPPLDLIRDDAQQFKIVMTKRLANADNPCQSEVTPAIHPTQHQKRPRTLSPPPSGERTKH